MSIDDKIRRDCFDSLVYNPVVNQLWESLNETHAKNLFRQGFERHASRASN